MKTLRHELPHGSHPQPLATSLNKNTKMLYDNPLELYEYLLLGPLCEIYKARKKSKLYDWQIYSNLLIDKFAIHSSSFFHI